MVFSCARNALGLLSNFEAIRDVCLDFKQQPLSQDSTLFENADNFLSLYFTTTINSRNGSHFDVLNQKAFSSVKRAARSQSNQS